MSHTSSGGGTVATVRDAPDGISTTLKHANYQLDTAGPGYEPHPSQWATSAGHFRAVCTGASELAGHLAGAIDRWITDHPEEAADNLAVMGTAATDLKETSRTLVALARQFGGVRSGLDGTGD
ncbi:hypothetical protein [Actinoplanes sp. NPDC049802]|uniref:hypothetical protein n=1 Tax=Actinoplanes sp. NPDC049802 TaxID=3154742 RepID=UPI0033FD86CE